MLNHIVIMGRLTRDPELRRTGSGIAVTSFTVAVDRDFAPKDGGDRETDFIDCIGWRQTGEFVSKYFTKGSMAVVSGRLQIRSWTDKDGNKRRTAEIVADNVYFGESKRTGQHTGGYNAPAPSYGSAPAPSYGGYNSAPDYTGYGSYSNPSNSGRTTSSDSQHSDYDLLDGEDEKLPF